MSKILCTVEHHHNESLNFRPTAPFVLMGFVWGHIRMWLSGPRNFFVIVGFHSFLTFEIGQFSTEMLRRSFNWEFINVRPTVKSKLFAWLQQRIDPGTGHSDTKGRIAAKNLWGAICSMRNILPWNFAHHSNLWHLHAPLTDVLLLFIPLYLYVPARTPRTCLPRPTIWWKSFGRYHYIHRIQLLKVELLCRTTQYLQLALE